MDFWQSLEFEDEALALYDALRLCRRALLAARLDAVCGVCGFDFDVFDSGMACNSPCDRGGFSRLAGKNMNYKVLLDH